jgi:hypothetical protein
LIQRAEPHRGLPQLGVVHVGGLHVEVHLVAQVHAQDNPLQLEDLDVAVQVALESSKFYETRKSLDDRL